MELSAAPLNLPQNQINALAGFVPVMSVDAGVRGADQDLRLRKQKLIIQQASSGVPGVAAEDRPADGKAKGVRERPGAEGVFVGVGGALLPEDGLLWHTVFQEYILKEGPLCFVGAGILFLLFLHSGKAAGQGAVPTRGEQERSGSLLPEGGRLLGHLGISVSGNENDIGRGGCIFHKNKVCKLPQKVLVHEKFLRKNYLLFLKFIY